MANSFTPTDVYQLFNDVVKQATGRTDLVATDSTSFSAVGQVLLNVGSDNVINAISTVIGRTIFAVRPYNAKLISLYIEPMRWGGILRKITPFGLEYEASTDLNTNLNPNQLQDGKSVDMYPIKKPGAMQLNFIGADALQNHYTTFRHQYWQAFRSEAEFMSFVNATMVKFNNGIELGNEMKTRLTLLNYIAGLYDMQVNQKTISGSVVDLIEAYNVEFSTEYTRQQLLTEHLTDFMQFFVSYVEILSDRLTDISVMRHANITGYPNIERHTPKQFQKLILYAPLFSIARARVFSEIFNPIYLELGQNFETVNYWQSQQTPTSINIKPNTLDTATGNSKDATAAVSIPYVLGALFDRDACGIMPIFDYTSTTPFNSAGGYWNTYYHWLFNSNIDYTENGVLFILGAGGKPTENSRIPIDVEISGQAAAAATAAKKITVKTQK